MVSYDPYMDPKSHPSAHDRLVTVLDCKDPPPTHDVSVSQPNGILALPKELLEQVRAYV